MIIEVICRRDSGYEDE
jgi:hypothetical protein